MAGVGDDPQFVAGYEAAAQPGGGFRAFDEADVGVGGLHLVGDGFAVGRGEVDVQRRFTASGGRGL